MKRVVVILAIWIILSLMTAVPAPLSHRFQRISERRANDQMLLKLYADLNNDSKDEFIYASRTPDYAIVMVNDIHLNVHSQLNYPAVVRCITVLANPLTHERILFTSYNDGNKVYLNSVTYTWETQLKRRDGSFEAIELPREIRTRSPWEAVINPKFIDDLDGDGALELVCIGYDSWHAYPRGIIVYDL